jgi:hypothetical protein
MKFVEITSLTALSPFARRDPIGVLGPWALLPGACTVRSWWRGRSADWPTGVWSRFA